MRRVVPVSGPASTSAMIWTNRTLTSVTGTCQSRAVQSCEPSGSRDLAFQGRSTSSLSGKGPPATGGSPRQTPCLPWNVSGNWWRPVATDLACSCRLWRSAVCRRLPRVATTGLHKGSILQAFGGRVHTPSARRLTWGSLLSEPRWCDRGLSQRGLSCKRIRRIRRPRRLRLVRLWDCGATR